MLWWKDKTQDEEHAERAVVDELASETGAKQ
jgi:hypothetical protein